jgi:hypothetical protein
MNCRLSLHGLLHVFSGRYRIYKPCAHKTGLDQHAPCRIIATRMNLDQGRDVAEAIKAAAAALSGLSAFRLDLSVITAGIGQRPVLPTNASGPRLSTFWNRNKSLWLPDGLKTQKWRTLPKQDPRVSNDSGVRHEGLEPPTPCASWTPGVFVGVRWCLKLTVNKPISAVECPWAVAGGRGCWLPVWLPGFCDSAHRLDACDNA